MSDLFQNYRRTGSGNVELCENCKKLIGFVVDFYSEFLFLPESGDVPDTFDGDQTSKEFWEMAINAGFAYATENNRYVIIWDQYKKIIKNS